LPDNILRKGEALTAKDKTLHDELDAAVLQPTAGARHQWRGVESRRSRILDTLEALGRARQAGGGWRG
jgi:hypothetical protein